MILGLSTKLIIASVAIGAVTFAYMGWAKHQQKIGEDRVTAIYNDRIDKLNKDAADKLAALQALVNGAQKALTEFKNTQELKDAKNKSTVATLSRKLRDLASSTSGQLLDPNAIETCGQSSSANTDRSAPGTVNSDTDRTKTSRLLSKPLSELLQQSQDSADEINIAYISCRADSRNLREQLLQLRAAQLRAIDAQ